MIGCVGLSCFKRLIVGLSLQRYGFFLRPIHVGFVIGNLEMAQAFLRVLLFPALSIIQLTLYVHTFTNHRLCRNSAIESVYKKNTQNVCRT